MKSLVVAILDRSGSMASQIDDAIGGINTFIEEQGKEPGYCEYEEILFDDTRIHNLPVDILTVRKHDTSTYVPRGGTALLDAIGFAITSVGERLANTPESERPDKVVFAILTDGEENQSREYSKAQILEMIEHQQSVYSWDFVYLAASEIGAEYGKGLGIVRSAMYNPSDITTGYQTMSCMVSQARQTI